MRSLIGKNTIFFLPYFLLLMGSFMLQLWISSPMITFMINSWHNTLADPVFVLFTDLGNGLTTLLVCFLLLFVSYGRALIFLILTNIAGLFAQIFKWLIDSPRPFIYFSHHNPLLHFVQGIQIFRDHSFPSGHTTTAFSMAVLLVLFSKKKQFTFIYLLLAIGVAWSRIYLGEHFFADVVGGSILGTITSLIGFYLINRTKIPEGQWYNCNIFSKKLV